MIYIHGIRDIPKHFAEGSDPLQSNRSSRSNFNYYLQYKFLGQTVKYPLNLSKAEDFESMLKLKLEKMRIFYFFVEDRKNIVEFIKS